MRLCVSDSARRHDRVFGCVLLHISPSIYARVVSPCDVYKAFYTANAVIRSIYTLCLLCIYSCAHVFLFARPFARHTDTRSVTRCHTRTTMRTRHPTGGMWCACQCAWTRLGHTTQLYHTSLFERACKRTSRRADCGRLGVAPCRSAGLVHRRVRHHGQDDELLTVE